jgi:hypothetical protein
MRTIAPIEWDARYDEAALLSRGLWTFLLQFLERWLLALTGFAGISGGVIACVLFVLSSGYFFPELRQRSKVLFLSAGLVSLIGGTLLFNEIGQWIGIVPQWNVQQTDGSSLESTTIIDPSASGGSLSTFDSGTGLSTLPSTSTLTGPTLPPAYPTYTVLSAVDGSWPALWSDVSSAAYVVTTLSPGAEVQLTGDCVSDVSSNMWCPVTSGGLFGWVASASLAAK